MGSDNDVVVDVLLKQIAEAERQLMRLKAALATYRDQGNSLPAPVREGSVGVIPPIVDISKYLAMQARPTSQNDIVRFVGEMRQRRYPQLTNHYSNVWRALEYHVRHNRQIICVDQQGRPTELKPLERRPKGRKLTNSPELYEGDNWFMLKEPAAEEHHSGQLRL